MIQELIDIAREAGKRIQEVAESSFNVTLKEDQTPVTEADMASHNYITEALAEKFPDIPLLSEENYDLTRETRQSWNKYFLVDPLDGTKGFIKQDGNYAVLISLVENGRPIVGVVHAPVLNETWYGEKGKGAFKIHPDGKEEQIKVVKAPERVRVAVSRNHLNDITSKFVEEHIRDHDVHSIGSAIKICRVAEGTVDIYPRLGPTSEWDTAAGEVILTEAGGHIVQYENKELLEYNKDDLSNPWFLAFGTSLEDLN